MKTERAQGSDAAEQSESAADLRLIQLSQETVMKRTIARMGVVIAFATAFALAAAASAQAGEHRVCSNGSPEGSYGFTSTGTLLALPTPFAGAFAEIGRQTFDGRGNTDGTATASANGNINHFILQGTYVVNPDCTGSMTLFVSPINATVNLEFVIDDDGAELRAITTGPTGTGTPGNVESREYTKQFPRGRKD